MVEESYLNVWVENTPYTLDQEPKQIANMFDHPISQTPAQLHQPMPFIEAQKSDSMDFTLYGQYFASTSQPTFFSDSSSTASSSSSISSASSSVAQTIDVSEVSDLSLNEFFNAESMCNLLDYTSRPPPRPPSFQNTVESSVTMHTAASTPASMWSSDHEAVVDERIGASASRSWNRGSGVMGELSGEVCQSANDARVGSDECPPSPLMQQMFGQMRRDTTSSIATTISLQSEDDQSCQLSKVAIQQQPEYFSYFGNPAYENKSEQYRHLSISDETAPVLSYNLHSGSVSSVISEPSPVSPVTAISPDFDSLPILLSTGIIKVSVPHPELDDPNEPHVQQYPLPPPEMPRKHSQNRTYRCRHCTQLFASSGDLKTHVLTLPDDSVSRRPYKCANKDCDWHVIGFHRNNDCTRHFRQVHGVREFVCRWQGARECRTHRFVTAWLRNRHERTVHAMELDKVGDEKRVTQKKSVIKHRRRS
ncbi:uncharacterized protein V2V93DRAFT_364651 [Kockiozyma suomiensis]|uniref:uncharacterized protein n=1 Tax=Kockiozyma suomiensis TaxID=1337062 RepID=UPI00334384E6